MPLGRMALPAVLAVAIIVLGTGVSLFGPDSATERALGLVASRGPVFFVISVAGLASVGVPRAALTVVGALAFGMWPGALLAWLASLLGALLGFAGSRALLRPSVSRAGPSHPEAFGPVRRRTHALLQTSSLASWWAVLLARLSPLPFWLVSWGAGATKVSGRGFTVGSALGLVPSAIAYSAAGTSIASLVTSGVAGWAVLGLMGVLLVGHRVVRTVRAKRAVSSARCGHHPSPS